MAILLGASVSTWEVSNDFSRSTDEIVSTAEQLLELTIDAAAEAVYQLDISQAENLLRGLMQHELFVKTVIFDELGQELTSVERPRAELTGIAALIEVPLRNFEYDLLLPGNEELFGQLTATLDIQAGLTRFIEVAVTNIVGLMLEAVGFAILIFLIVVYTVTNPVGKLARSLSKIEPGSDDRLDLDEAHRTDEIGNLITSTNKYLDVASRYQHELVRNRQNLQDTVDTLLDGIITVDKHGLIVNLNKASKKMFGFSENTGLGLPFISIFCDRKYQDFEELVEAVSRVKGTGLESVGKIDDSNTFPVELSMSPIVLVDEQHSLWTIRDISGRVQAEHARSELEAQLRHSQKMEAIGTLAGGIAHDFNNILGGIIGFTELAISETREDSNIQKYLENVLSGSKNATLLVSRILAFSHKQEEDKEAVDLIEIVKESTAFIQRTIPATIKLVVELGVDSFIVMADRSMMHQVLINLYTNAASAIGNNPGEIRVTLDIVDKHSASFLNQISNFGENKGISPEKFVQISIQDSGPGIPEEIVHRIFEPYFTTKNIGSGTGIGLALVHSILENHDGYIEVGKSTSGALFKIYLPAAAENDKPNPRDEVESRGYETGTERILIADDNDMITSLLFQILSRQGYEVVVTPDGEHALSEYSKHDNYFDLVISDQTMPGMNGDKLIKEIFAIRPDQATILCSGYSDSITQNEAILLGIKRFLVKPIPLKVLCKVVREVLDEAASKA